MTTIGLLDGDDDDGVGGGSGGDDYNDDDDNDEVQRPSFDVLLLALTHTHSHTHARAYIHIHTLLLAVRPTDGVWLPSSRDRCRMEWPPLTHYRYTLPFWCNFYRDCKIK